MSEIKLISTTALKSTLDDVVPGFERATGHKVVATYGPSPRMAKQIAEGAVCDAAIVSAQGVEDLIKQGKIVAGSSAAIARSRSRSRCRRARPSPTSQPRRNSRTRCWRQSRSP